MLDVRTVSRIKQEAYNARHEGRSIDQHSYGTPEKKAIYELAYKNAEPYEYEGLNS